MSFRFWNKQRLVDEQPDEVRVGGRWRRVMVADGYPGNVGDGWLDKLITMPGSFDMSLNIMPLEKDRVLEQLRRELLKQKSDIESHSKRGERPPDYLQAQYEDTLRVREAIQNDEENILDISLYVSPEADSLKGLDLLTKKLKSALNAIGIVPKTPYMRMMEGFKCTLPTGPDKPRITRNITSSGLASCFPFKTTNLIEMDGVLFGANAENKVPVIPDPYNMENPNGLILGSPESGKSFFAKLYGMRQWMMGAKVHVIDPRGEYTELTQALKGETINFSPNSGSAVNPFDLEGASYKEKILSMHSLMHALIDDISPVKKSLLDMAFNRVYAKAGITLEKDTWGNTPPTFKEFYAEIEAMCSDENHLNHSAAQALSSKLRPHVEMNYLNGQTKLSYGEGMASFDISEVPDKAKPALMYLLLERLNQRLRKDRERKVVIVDEAWLLLQHPHVAERIFESLKTSQYFKLSYAIVISELYDLMYGEAGDILLENTSWRLLLNQDKKILDEVAKTFKLDYSQTMRLLDAKCGEGVLSVYDNRMPLNVIASPREIELAAIKADIPRLQRWHKPAKKPEIIVEAEEPKKRFSIDKVVQLKNDLTSGQVDILLRNGFREVRDPGFIKGSGSIYMVKNATGETDPHFILWNLIQDEVNKYTDNVTHNLTKEPDVIFTSKDGRRVGIEVETGRKSELKIGRKLSVLEKYDDWFIVVINREDKEYYQNYGPSFTRVTVQEKIRTYFAESEPPSLPEQQS